jgi:Alpha-glucosidases, family 31 of glycosyl hydrolases
MGATNVIRSVRTVIAMCFFGSLLSINSFSAPISVTSSSQDADGESFVMATGKMKLKVCAPNIIHVMYTPSGNFSTRASLIVSNAFATPPAFTVASTATAVTVSTTQMKAEVTLATGAIRFLDASGAVLIGENPDTGKICSVASVDNTGYGVHLAFNITASEGVYGGGHYDLDNTMNRNAAGQQFRTLPGNRDKPIPFIISTNQWGVLWDNYSDTYWNFSGASSRTLSIRSEVADQIDYYLIYGQELDNVVAGYRTVTGAAPMLPRKVFGFWHSKCQYDNQAALLSDVSSFRSKKIPIDVIVQDWLWWDDNVTSTDVGTRNGYWNSMKWDPNRYADPTGTINTVHNNNMLLAISVWPTLGLSTPVYTDFKGKGYTWPLLYVFGSAYVYDAFNPTAGALLWSYMNTGTNGTNGVFNKGIDIWWFDGSEPETGNNQGDNFVNLKGAITSQSGGNFLGSFYRYPAGYSLAHSRNVYTNQRAVTSSTKRVCVLTRSVYAGQQRYGTITWVGDAQSNWAQYQREIAMGCNFCAAGVPYWTTDVGAFYSWTGVSSGAEIFTRWFQFATFLPIMRVHGQSDRNMWLFSGSYYNSQIKFDSLRYRMLPYMYSNAWKVTNQGYTLMRTLPFDFRTDVTARNQTTEYMFGSAFLVAPITTQGATSRSVYLPTGSTWYDFWSGAASAGGASVTSNADIMSMPVFVKGGSIVPLGPNLQYTNEKKADTIELRVYPGSNGSFTLYEDEGDNYNYETGSYATVPITYVDNPRNVIIGARSGSFTGMLTNRVFKVVYVGSGHGTGIAMTANPDCTLNYSGAQVSCSAVGTVLQNSEANSFRPMSVTLKITGNSLVLGREFEGKSKSIVLYDLGGKLVAEKTLRTNIINLHKDLGVPKGEYIAKIKTMPVY